MVGEARAAVDKRVVARAEGEHVEIAQISRIGVEGLLRHAHEFVAVDDDPMRIEIVMTLEEAAVPGRSLRAGGKRGAGRGRSVCAEPSAVMPAEVNRGDVKLLQVPHANYAIALEALVSDSCARDSHAAVRVLEISVCLADVGKAPDALKAEAAKLESTAGGKEAV